MLGSALQRLTLWWRQLRMRSENETDCHASKHGLPIFRPVVLRPWNCHQKGKRSARKNQTVPKMIALRLAHSNQYLSDFAVTCNYLSQKGSG
jgi:hypothetical protein